MPTPSPVAVGRDVQGVQPAVLERREADDARRRARRARPPSRAAGPSPAPSRRASASVCTGGGIAGPRPARLARNRSATARQVVGRRPGRQRSASAQSASRIVSRACGRSAGYADSYSTYSPVSGCSNPRRTACSHCRSSPTRCGQRRVGAVGQVADARVLERGHVHPDLVGAPGLEVHLEQAGEPVRLERLVVGDAVLAVGASPRTCSRACGCRPIGASMVPAQRVGVALHQRVVGLVDGAVPEGVLEHASRRARTWRSPSRPRCRRRAAARCPAARRRRWWRSGSRRRARCPTTVGPVQPGLTGARRRRPACRPPRWRRRRGRS